MKKLQLVWAIFLTLLMLACENNTTPSIEGKIDNLPEDVNEVIIRTEKEIKKLAIEEGTFKDTIHFKNQFTLLQIGNINKMLYLGEHTQLKITADANDFNNTLAYSGDGSKDNQYIHQREQITINVLSKLDEINKLSEEAFNKYLNNLETELKDVISQNAGIDASLELKEKEGITAFVKGLKDQYAANNRVVVSLEPGKPSPEFNNLENYQGGTTSLADLKGNYVYIDVWATWCMPCLQQIPYLQNLEQKLHGKKIKFVSLSIDSPSAKDKWKQMIQDKNMGGVQLFANGSIPFIQDYQISGIPRFILLDKQGNIVDANAPRPSDPEFGKYLAELVH